MGCVFSLVIWSESQMGQYRDDNHREDAPHFRTHIKHTQTNISGDLELILKKRDAADHQFFRLEDGNLVVKERFLNSSQFLD